MMCHPRTGQMLTPLMVWLRGPGELICVRCQVSITLYPSSTNFRYPFIEPSTSFNATSMSGCCKHYVCLAYVSTGSDDTHPELNEVNCILQNRSIQYLLHPKTPRLSSVPPELLPTLLLTPCGRKCSLDSEKSGTMKYTVKVKLQAFMEDDIPLQTRSKSGR